MNKKTNKDILLDFVHEVWNNAELDKVDRFISKTFAIKNDPGDQFDKSTIDRATYKKRLADAQRVFPDLCFHVEEIIDGGDQIALSWYMSGTQRGDLPNMPATNKAINVSGMTIYYFKDGRITGHWQVFDRLGLLQQFGIRVGE